MPRRTLAVSATALALTLASCAQQQGTSASGSAPVGGAAGQSSSAPASAQGPSQSTLGASVKYPDGLVVQTSRPARFVPSEYAAGSKPGVPNIAIGLTIVNGTKQAVDATMFGANLTYGANGETADTVFDSDRGVQCNFTQKILPGRRASVRCGYSVPQAGANQLQLQVNGGFDRDPAVFTGSL